MPRKLFISILGTGYYENTKYYFGYKENHFESRYIQEATMLHFLKDWTEHDVACILLTTNSEKTNWNSPANENNKFGKTSYTGLHDLLLKHNFNFKIINEHIPDGNNEAEIWEIFEKVFNLIEDEDEIYFDITHAFRSIPMLVMVLINYAKFLKNISVKMISYGNYAGCDEFNQSPIIDLTAFSDLQDWTSAANDFVNFGNVNKLTEVSKKNIKPLERIYKGTNKTVTSLNKISNLLPIFIANIQTCRGKSIIKNTEGVLINSELKNIKENLISPLTPILNKIEDEIYPFIQEDNLINGFNAVNWCLKNNLFQQGFTILQENIISVICKELELDNTVLINRNIVGSCFHIKKNNISEENWANDAKKNEELTKNILTNSKLIDLLMPDYYHISDIRNDLNHSGYKSNPINPVKISDSLNKFYCNILKKLQLQLN